MLLAITLLMAPIIMIYFTGHYFAPGAKIDWIFVRASAFKATSISPHLRRTFIGNLGGTHMLCKHR